MKQQNQHQISWTTGQSVIQEVSVKDDFKEVEDIIKNDGEETYIKNNILMEKAIAGYCRKKVKNRMPTKHTTKVSPHVLREVSPFMPIERMANESANYNSI